MQHNKYGQRLMPLALTKIKNGWAAHGDGWAVHAATKEEAIQKYCVAEIRHQEIDKLPFWYEQSPDNGKRRLNYLANQRND